jgi:hypothetical protein
MKPYASLALLLALAGVCSAGEKAERDWSALAAKNKDAFPVVLDQLRVTRIRGLDPFATWNDPPPGVPRFHKWVVTWSAPLKESAASSALTRSMRVIVDSPSESMAACFEPHHGATLSDGKHTFDVVMCFDCSRYVVYTPDGRLAWGGSFTTAQTEKLVWDRIFRDATPGDRTVAYTRLTPRWSGPVIDKVPGSNVGTRAGQLNR